MEDIVEKLRSSDGELENAAADEIVEWRRQAWRYKRSLNRIGDGGVRLMQEADLREAELAALRDEASRLQVELWAAQKEIKRLKQFEMETARLEEHLDRIERMIGRMLNEALDTQKGEG